MVSDLRERLLEWIGDGIAPEQIGLLYRADAGGWVAPLMKSLQKSFPVRWRREPTAAIGITLTTIHASKGLQWKAVVLLKPEQMPFIHPTEKDRIKKLREHAPLEADREEEAIQRRERGLMYVAITRAEHRLLLMCEQGGGFADTLLTQAQIGSGRPG